MCLFLMRLEHLGAAHPRSAGLFAGLTRGLARRVWPPGFGLRHFPWRWRGFAVLGASSIPCPPSVRAHGARLLGGRELFSGPWFNRSRFL